MNRRDFLKTSARFAAVAAIGGGASHLVLRKGTCDGKRPCDQCPQAGDCPDDKAQQWRAAQPVAWQIDPYQCIQCGKCATTCVLKQSAVRCFHAYAVCGYCDLCTGFYSDYIHSNETVSYFFCNPFVLSVHFSGIHYFQLFLFINLQDTLAKST